MVRWAWIAAWGLSMAAALTAGPASAPAQAQPAPTTHPAPFIQPLPEPAVPTTRPGGAPYIQPLPEPAIGPVAGPPTTIPAGPFIRPTTEPASRPAVAPTSGPASQPAGAAQKVDEPKTLGFSAWVAVEQGSRCVDLAKMPADVRELWQKHCTTKGRILAERAARDDAIAQLARRVGDLAIGPDLTVRKFLAGTDQPDAHAELFLHGAAVLAVRYRANALVAEVELEIRPRTLLASIKGWARSHVNGNRDLMAQLENALLQPDDTPLLQIGRSTVPAAEILSPTPDLLEATRAATQPAITQPPATQPAKPLPTPPAAPAATQPAITSAPQ